jgi:cytochrome P450
MSFIPERFLEPNISGETCDRKAWIPFSTGLRGCIGRPLAMMEMKCAIARFVWAFDAEMERGEGPTYEECFVAQRSAFNIRVEPVQREGWFDFRPRYGAEKVG